MRMTCKYCNTFPVLVEMTVLQYLTIQKQRNELKQEKNKGNQCKQLTIVPNYCILLNGKQFLWLQYNYATIEGP